MAPPSSPPKTSRAGVPLLLTYSDSSSEPTGSTLLPKGNGHSPDREKTRWTLTPAAFDKLLCSFSANRDEAGVQYELARRKVVRFFEWRAVGAAEDYADETINRVARRIDEGQNIDKLMAYIFGVARVILKEAIKERDRAPIALDEAPETKRQTAPEPVDPDVREICLDRCLEELGVESRDLILSYYEGQGRAKIDNRQELADKLHIPLNALRIRVHRIKRILENCLAECLQGAAARNL